MSDSYIEGVSSLFSDGVKPFLRPFSATVTATRRMENIEKIAAL